VTVLDAAKAAAAALTPAERAVVEAVLAEPTGVAFGTVADLARRSGTSGPTVVRVARKLGFDGFRQLQAAVQAEMQAEVGGALAPAVERIRQRRAPGGGRGLEAAMAAEVANVEASLSAADTRAYATAVRLLADRRRQVFVVAGEAERGVAVTVADQLGQLRDGVTVVAGAPTRTAAQVAVAAGQRATVLAVDVRRYDAWLLDAVAALRVGGADVVAVTDGPLSPLTEGAAAWFAVRAEGAGPFDSHVGTLALLHALVAGVADRLRGSATARLEQIERAWQRTSAMHGAERGADVDPPRRF
jgi:DNA-binding MurR/RpiR family transcriptional regulator